MCSPPTSSVPGNGPAGDRRAMAGRRSGLCSRGPARGLDGLDPDPLLGLGGMLEPDPAGQGREHGVIPAEPGARARKERHSALPDDDRAGRNELAVADLDAQPLADRVAAVLRAGTGFLVGHGVCSSFFFARGFAFAAGFASAAPLWVLARGVFAAALFAALFDAGFAAVFALDFVAGLASALAVDSFGGAFAVDAFASFAANAASSAACFAAASSRRCRSVLASASALRFASAALLFPSFTSVIRSTRSSCRWPFFTRLRAFGRYLKETVFWPRSRRTTSASTAAFATIGVPMAESSPSATRRTRSSVMLSPGSAASSSTSSSVPTSTRYCFPPVSMTAYMEPFEA